MGKVKFIAIVIGGVTLAYLLLTSMMGILSDLATAGAAEVARSSYASEYVGAQEGLEYMPFVLYFIPGIIGITLIIWKLKISKDN